MCGSISGAVAAALTTPLDFLKTRLMLGPTRRQGLLDLSAEIVREEGWLVFLSGMG